MAALSFGDIQLDVTNLDKVLYPETGTTKGQVIEYYVEIAPALLPHIVGRPVTRKRWPNGVTEEPFFEKNLVSHAPSWIARRGITHTDREIVYPVIDNVAGVAWLGQQASLEVHVPQWRFADDGSMGPATRLVFDLDPGEGVGLTECAEVAVAVRDMVAEIGFSAFPVTSGSKGIHLYVPLDRALSPGGSSTVAKQVAKNLETMMPGLVTANMSKAVRVGKVFLDWSQNNEAKTTIAPYSMRGRALPTVAAPRTWAEIESPEDLRQLLFGEVLERYRRDGDLLAGLDPVSDSLDKYRSMRDPRKTPEPMPLRVNDRKGNSFVIQEHHARRLHYDVRLERDGVLASWAVPKGPPTEPGENHLAVRTEDHPIEYLSFAGTIPKGEYGAGVMTIWDTGTYDTEKWRYDEVIVRLRGEKVSGRYALIRTQGDQWLMHYMRDQRIPDMPPPIQPMLATPGDIDRLGADDWAFEGKWDGYRLVVEFTGGKAVARTRNGNIITARFPILSTLARELEGHSVVLDGEIVVRDREGITSFGLLQQGGKNAEFIAFDVLFLDGVSLLNKPYRDRRKILEAVHALSETLQVPPLLEGDGAAAQEFSQQQGWEGVIAKKRDSTYLPGKRTNTWIKAKNWQSEEVVIGGWRPGAGGRTIGALLVGVPSMNGLRFAGRVGTGFTDKAMADLAERLAPLRRDTSPFEEKLPPADQKDAVWVDPMLVGEVRFTEWTGDGRLRHPAWRGLVLDR